MSFAERIVGLITRPNESAQGEVDETPLLLKYGTRVLAVVGGFFAILFGLINCVTSILSINVLCLISGALEILAGFIVMALEIPQCFFCIEHVNTMAKNLNVRPVWQRAAVYCLVALPPVMLCRALASFFGCGLIFAAGSLYGMMAVGKKASREDMAAAATSPTQMPTNGGQMPMGTDQHITLMEDPDVWRPT